jgi:hypothetical protein
MGPLMGICSNEIKLILNVFLYVISINFMENISAGSPDKFDKYGFRLENFEDFRPKKYYLEPESEEELKQNLDKMEAHLKSYKYFEEIPRMNFRNAEPTRGIDRYEEAMWWCLVTGPFIGYKLGHSLYGNYFHF